MYLFYYPIEVVGTFSYMNSMNQTDLDMHNDVGLRSFGLKASPKLNNL